MKSATEEGSSLTLTHEAGPNGADELVVRIDARAQGDFSTSDYGRDSSIESSDNLRIYRFDPETKRLVGMQVYVHQPQGDVLVLETKAVTYDEPLSDSLFALAIPADAIRYAPLQITSALPEADTPEGTARAFFEACAAEDWPRALKFTTFSAVPGWIQKNYGGLQIISIGKPFQSGTYCGWYVPYEVRLKDGNIKKYNLAVRNDNAAKQYVFDGGLGY